MLNVIFNHNTQERFFPIIIYNTYSSSKPCSTVAKTASMSTLLCFIPITKLGWPRNDGFGHCYADPTLAGYPLTSKLSTEFGLPFIAAYVACYMFITLGIFNVILAVSWKKRVCVVLCCCGSCCCFFSMSK